VELGCGTGENVLYWNRQLPENNNIELIGIDHSEAMLNRAKEKLIDIPNRNRIHFLNGNLTNFADCLGKIADCILLPAGTFHHLIDNNQRQEYLRNLHRTLRPETGLCAVYLLPDSMIRVEATNDPGDNNNNNKLILVSTENDQQTDDEWICKQTFAFDESLQNRLSWHLRTCSSSSLIHLYTNHGFEPVACCLNGKDLVSYEKFLSDSSTTRSTPVIIVFRIKNPKS
jgi:ubiquinone/menaquinone biosynthesis C-methylase UbiE